MSQDITTESSHSSKIELTARSSTKTQTLLETCVLDADHEALEEHLVNNPVQQSDLDRCLLRGLQIVQQKERELSHVAQALTMLLKSGAKWNNNAMLDEQKTPYHIICESSGDHHELLDLMIKASQHTIIDTRDSSECTALMYAVQNENINCLKCFIANGADVNKGDASFHTAAGWAPPQELSAIIQVMRYTLSVHELTSIHKDMFELLLGESSHQSQQSLIILAIAYRNIYCTKKLIERGVCFYILDHNGCCVWTSIAKLGSVELLTCMLNYGIDKDITDRNGLCLLWYVVDSGNIEAVRYLLKLGVTIPIYTPKVSKRQCKQCKKNTLIVDDITWTDPMYHDRCIRAVCDNNLEMVKLLDEHRSKSCKSFNALRHALFYGSVDVTLYLINKYKYPLIINYTKQSESHSFIYTHLTAKITKLLLDHGADPAKQMCSATSVNAIMSALDEENLEVIARFIRSGVDVNFRSCDRSYKKVLPFEVSVLRGYLNAAEMFLISGCCCGVFSLTSSHKFKNNLNPEVKKLMKEWKVQENNVKSLKQRCRNVILNHLSPRADVKIGKLPLPGLLIKFLSIPELDEIVDTQK